MRRARAQNATPALSVAGAVHSFRVGQGSTISAIAETLGVGRAEQ